MRRNKISVIGAPTTCDVAVRHNFVPYQRVANKMNEQRQHQQQQQQTKKMQQQQQQRVRTRWSSTSTSLGRPQPWPPGPGHIMSDGLAASAACNFHGFSQIRKTRKYVNENSKPKLNKLRQLRCQQCDT